MVLPIGLLLSFDVKALDPALNPRLVVLSLVLTPAFLLNLKNPRFPAALNSLPSLLFALFILIELLAWFYDGRRIEGLVVLLKDMGFYLLFLVAASQDWTAKRMNFLAWSAFATLLIILGFVIFEDLLPNWRGGFADFPFTRLSGRMAHHNLLASALVVLLPIVLIQTKNWSRVLASVLLIFALALILFTRSRSAQLALMAGGVFFMLSYLLRRRIPGFELKRRKVFLLGLLLLIPLLLVQYKVLLPNTGDGKSLQSRHLDLSSTEKNFTTGERLKIWDYSLAMIQEHGLLGVGPGQWKSEFPSYGSEVYRSRQGMVQFQRPHNDYLWIWAEIGPFGLVVFLLFVLVTLVLVLSNIRHYNQACEALIGAAFLSLLVVSLFSFPRERIFHQYFFFLTAGIIHSKALAKADRSLPDLKAAALGLAAFLILGLLSIASLERWRGERISRKMIVAHGDSDWEALLRFKAQTDALDFYPLSPVGMPMEFYSGLAYLNQGDLPSALAEYQKAYQLHHNNLQVTNNLANTYTLMGEVDSALVYYRRAIEISPFYKEGILNLASTYFNNAQLEGAYAVLREKAAVFDDDRELYEQYVLIVLKAWTLEYEIDLSTMAQEQILKWHYILAYDVVNDPALEYIKARALNP